ncbi:hypothetical protein ONZ45_g12541 [Pleurotus djamor]|nr:hypothetical protein ONZ45_g12541 [Pleurotus djamor]
MPFINYGEATVETYNDVAGDLHTHNTTNVYYNGPCVVTPASKRKHNRKHKKKKQPGKPFIQLTSLYDEDEDDEDDNLGYLRLVEQPGLDPSCYTVLATWTVEGVVERVDEMSSDLFGMMLSDPNLWMDNKKSEKTAKVYLEKLAALDEYGHFLYHHLRLSHC